jgi:WD40 repeat protein
MKVLSYIIGGSSTPIIVQHEDQKILVKLSGGLSGQHSIISEWFGNRVGQLIGLNTRQPKWIELTTSLRYENIYVEVRDLIEKSLGVNIGFEYLDDVQPLTHNDLSALNLENYSNAYLLDVLMINIDRTRQNLNLLASSNGEIIISDFDSSLIFYELLKGSLIAKDNRILQALKTNPFYQPIDKVTLQEFIEKVNRLNFDEIFDEIPSILLDKQSKQDLLSKINKKMIRGWDLLDTLKSIDNTIIESESERDLRIRNNREKLEHLVRLTNNRSR